MQALNYINANEVYNKALEYDKLFAIIEELVVAGESASSYKFRQHLTSDTKRFISIHKKKREDTQEKLRVEALAKLSEKEVLALGLTVAVLSPKTQDEDDDEEAEDE